jgi:HK97 family phage portal protein
MNWRFWEKKTDFTELTWRRLLGDGYEDASGVVLTLDRALQVSTVLACARVIAEGVAQLPLKIYQETEDGGKEPNKDHPAYWLLYRRPNDWMTSFEFRETLTFHAVLAKGGFAYINRNPRDGAIRELIPIAPGMVTVNQGLDYAVTYEVRDKDGLIKNFSAAEILHVRGPSWNGYDALEMISVAREAIGLAAATELAQGRLFRNGASTKGILSPELPLDEKQAERLKTAFQDATTGQNQFKTVVLPVAMKYSQQGMTGIDAETLESRRFQIEEICRMMRVFPQMVMHSDKTSTYASAEQFFLAHVVHSLGPWIERWEQALSRDVLTDQEARSGLFPKFQIQGLLRGDAKTRMEYYRGMSEIRAISPNEIRSLEDMNPYEGGDEYGPPPAPAPIMAPAAEEEPADAAV